MGYEINLEYTNVVLKKQQHQEILNAWVDFKETKIKPENKMTKEQTFGLVRSMYDFDANTIDELLENMDIEYEKTINGDIKLKHFQGKGILVNEFLDKISFLIPKNSMMIWLGEDGTEFVWMFDGQRMTEETGSKTTQLLIDNIKKQEEVEKQKKENRYKKLL